MATFDIITAMSRKQTSVSIHQVHNKGLAVAISDCGSAPDEGPCSTDFSLGLPEVLELSRCWSKAWACSPSSTRPPNVCSFNFAPAMVSSITFVIFILQERESSTAVALREILDQMGISDIVVRAIALNETDVWLEDAGKGRGEVKEKESE